MSAQKNTTTLFQLEIRAFALSLGLVFGLMALIISIWSRSTGFADDFWKVYTSLHPTPFGAFTLGLELWQKVFGVVIDVVYAILDGVILGAVWGFLYNLFISKRVKVSDETLDE